MQIDFDRTLPIFPKFSIPTELTRSMQSVLDSVPEYKLPVPCYPGTVRVRLIYNRTVPGVFIVIAGTVL